MLEEVGEIKGNSAEARARRRERRGKKIAFTKQFTIGGKNVTVTAAGHNKKVPLLLVATASSMIPGEVHTKRWTTPNADGTTTLHEIRTEQPEMHWLYRMYMNLVDLHNKLRQGVCAMADVWQTTSWPERHFSELLGFTEVNIYKSMVYFIPQYKGLSHPDFRQRLAWAFLTLGKVMYPADAEGPGRSSAGSSSSGMWSTASSASALHGGPPCQLGSDSWVGQEHTYATFEKRHLHTCAYCGSRTRKYCATCSQIGRGMIPVCGRKSLRDCCDRHALGDKVKHAAWVISQQPKDKDGAATA